MKESRIKDSLDCLREFKRKAEEFGVNKIAAVGTAALREAENAREFLDRARVETGIDIRVITPEEEAFLTIEGIRLGLQLPEDFIAFDLGGGSTEFIISRHGSTDLLSIPIGVLKLSRLIETYPPSQEIVSQMRSAVKEALSLSNLGPLASYLSPEALIGTGGTVTTLASLDLSLEAYIPERIHGHRLSLRWLKGALESLSGLTLRELSEVKGMEKGREDIILAGLVAVMEIMELFSQESLIVSDFGILEGIIKYESMFHY